MHFRKLIVCSLLPGALLALAVSSAQAQRALKNDDISVDGFAAFTQTVSGNGITDTPSRAAGGAVSFRHSFHWWLGYEAGYEYTRYHESYTGVPFGVQHNQHEFSGSYLVVGPKAFGIQPFGLAGVSAVVQSPTLNGGQNVPWQAGPGANFGAGVNVPLLTSHIGLRLEYRALYYKAPGFGQTDLTTNAYRVTSEPMAGAYFRF